MNAPARRETHSFFPDLLDWMDAPFTMLRPLAAQPIRLEEFVDDGHYVVRAELPGIDPEKQVEITVGKQVLVIRAERHEEHEGKYRSEFRYGAFSRQIPLPVAANADDVKATYRRGVLEVRIGLKEPESAAARKIPVTKDA